MSNEHEGKIVLMASAAASPLVAGAVYARTDKRAGDLRQLNLPVGRNNYAKNAGSA